MREVNTIILLGNATQDEEGKERGVAEIVASAVQCRGRHGSALSLDAIPG